jgi:hypothetical protein
MVSPMNTKTGISTKMNKMVNIYCFFLFISDISNHFQTFFNGSGKTASEESMSEMMWQHNSMQVTTI